MHPPTIAKLNGMELITRSLCPVNCPQATTWFFIETFRIFVPLTLIFMRAILLRVLNLGWHESVHT